jgi:hypothetical protein
VTLADRHRSEALARVARRAAAVGRAELELSDARDALNAEMIAAVRKAHAPQKLVAAAAGLSKQRISAIMKGAT